MDKTNVRRLSAPAGSGAEPPPSTQLDGVRDATLATGHDEKQGGTATIGGAWPACSMTSCPSGMGIRQVISICRPQPPETWSAEPRGGVDDFGETWPSEQGQSGKACCSNRSATGYCRRRPSS